MKTLKHVQCPGCRGPMAVLEVRCESCDVTVRGHFALNEFAALEDEELHLLRIFILCEGRIRDMESALGLSYPSIKQKLAQLKEKLALGEPNHEGTKPRRAMKN